MTAYLNNPILLVSKTDPEEGIEDDISQSGIQHSIILRSGLYHTFDLVYDMTYAEFKNQCAQYDAGPRDFYTGFEYHEVSPMETYTVKYQGRPRITGNDGAGQFTVAVRLRGTLD